MHVTIASVFAVDWSDELKNELRNIVENHAPITLAAIKEGYWGSTKKFHCSIMDKSSDITSFHNKVFDLLLNHGAKFNEIQYHGEGFIPHSTYQKNARVAVGEKAKLKSLSIIDMFPNGDHLERLVTDTITFKLN